MTKNRILPSSSPLTFLEKVMAPFHVMKSIFTPIDDHWTWTTLDGRVFEKVVPIKVRCGQVLIEHKDGLDAVALFYLSDEVQKTLCRDFGVPEEDIYYAEIHADHEIDMVA